jgi:hypothetical protein
MNIKIHEYGILCDVSEYSRMNMGSNLCAILEMNIRLGS